MDRFESLRIFTRIVELGSFSAAAREENVTQPTISKTDAALEEALGLRLIERTTTRLSATEEGRLFYARIKAMMEDYADAVAEARGQARQLTGLLRVNGPVGLGELRLNGLVLDFLADYPEIEIELILNDRMIDLVEEGVDVAIRLGGDLPPNVIARPVAEAPRLLVAAPSYMKGRAALLRPEELADHDYIRFAGLAVGDRMEFFRAGETVAVPVGGRYRVNSSLALRQCFLDGVGLGTAPAWLVQDLIESGALFRLLPDWTMASQPLHLVYPSRKYQPARTKAFLRFMMERLPKLPGFQT